MSSQSHTFVAESTLGRLAKWLRLAGFDTIYDSGKPQAQRLAAYCRSDVCMILTRTARVVRALPMQHTIFLRSDTPLLQMRQVIRRLALTPQDLQPFSICAACNHPLVQLTKTDVQYRVTDYTYQHNEQFHGCELCGRIYWHGSHATRWLELMSKWFE